MFFLNVINIKVMIKNMQQILTIYYVPGQKLPDINAHKIVYSN